MPGSKTPYAGLLQKASWIRQTTPSYLTFAKKTRGDASISLTAVPIDKTHLPSAPGAGQSVTLHSIRDVSGVNKLAANQDLTFEAAGLTIVYGDNGTGKSGYARILKRACRARHAGTIIPDAFDDAAAAMPAAADICHSIGGVLQQPAKWKNGPNPLPTLSAVSVFDSDCAAVHIQEKNEVAFRPFGLDIPDELAIACQKVKEALEAEQQTLERARNPLFIKPTWGAETSVGKVMSALTEKSSLKLLERWSLVSDVERKRHQSLVEDLAKDPFKAAAEKDAAAASIGLLRGAIQKARAAAEDQVLQGLKALVVDAQLKRVAAKTAAEVAFGTASVRGVGDGPWRVLWEAAREYSVTVANIGKPFPPADYPSICLLCHQELDHDAIESMARFEAFIKADVDRQAQSAEKAADAALKQFNAYKVTGRQTASDRRQLKLENAALAARAVRALAVARLRLYQCRKALTENGPFDLAPFNDDPDADILAQQTATKAYAAELRSATDMQQRQKLELERDELRDRIALDTLLAVATDEINRQKKLKLLRDCIKDTATTAITKLGNDIADKFVTPQIRDRFQDEIVRLAANRIRVEVIRSGGKFGSPHYQVRLFANPQAKVHEVLSEGEQTCVALAAFLTELATATHQSTLVFDDPISSLDHRWRRQVAQRLVDESKVRQIIVFTHDIVFVNDLNQFANTASIPAKSITLDRGPKGAGVVSEGLPWVAARVESRLDKLEKEARASKAAFDAHDDEDYKNQVYRFYNRLRATWERAVEQVAFHHVVLRYRDYIDTKHLKKASVLNAADCDDFAAAYKKCCDQVEAHDPAGARNAQPPPPSDLLADTAALQAWVESIRNRQKQVS